MKLKSNRGGRPPLGAKKRAQHSITFCEEDEKLLNQKRTRKRGDGKPTRSDIVQQGMSLLRTQRQNWKPIKKGKKL